MRQETRLKRSRVQVAKWNAAHPVGTEVILTDDFGKKHATKTRSEAWVLLSGDAIINVEDRSGGYLLERIKAKT